MARKPNQLKRVLYGARSKPWRVEFGGLLKRLLNKVGSRGDDRAV